MDRDDWRGAVVGMTLGDASLYRTRFPNGQVSSDAVFSLTHGLKQRDYLMHKLGVVGSIFHHDIKVREKTINAPTGKVYKAVRFDTRMHSRLSFIRDRIYVPKKRITEWALEAITEEGLAYWWMDDGHMHRGTRKQRDGASDYPISIAVWALNGFPEKDVLRLRDWIEARYGVRFNSNAHVKRGFSLRLGGIKARPLLERLAAYAVPCMSYKFPVPSDSARHPEYQDDDMVHAAGNSGTTCSTPSSTT